MNYTRLTYILKRGKDVHMELRTRIDTDSENLNYAIYLLQGGALTCATTAFKFNLDGYQVPAAQQKRMLDEIVDLINFLEEAGDGSRQLKAWFKGHVVERTKDAVSIEERAKRNLVTQDSIRTIDKLTKQLNDIVSTWAMHPSITAVRANCTKQKNLFHYAHEGMSPKFNSIDFGSMFVNPALYTLLLPVRTLPLTKEQFDELHVYTKEIDSASY